MRRKLSSLLVIALCALPMLAQSEPSAQNKEQSKAELIKYMQQTRKEFENSVKGLSEAQLNFKPAPDRWSVKEVSEHIAKAESYLGDSTIKMVSSTPAEDEKSAMAGHEDKLVNMITDRSKKFQAPPPLVPNGQWATEADILKAFNEARNKNIDFVKKTDEKVLRSHEQDGPAGKLDAHEWELFMAGHTARHVKQIEEVKADPNFPKS